MNLYDIFADLRDELDGQGNKAEAATLTVAHKLQEMINDRMKERCDECEYKKKAKPAPVYTIGSPDPVDQDEELQILFSPCGTDCNIIAIAEGITSVLPEITGFRYRYFSHEMLLAMGIDNTSPLWDKPVAIIIRKAIFSKETHYPTRFTLINQWLNETGQAGYTKYNDVQLVSQESGITTDDVMMEEYLYYLAADVIKETGVAPEFTQFMDNKE